MPPKKGWGDPYRDRMPGETMGAPIPFVSEIDPAKCKHKDVRPWGDETYCAICKTRWPAKGRALK